MYFVIGADIVPTKSNIQLFSDGDKAVLLGQELQDILDNSSYRIFNLEVPLTDIEKPIKKQGPNLIAPVSTINGYKAIQIDLLTLANNHILDQGEEGVISTIKNLDDAGIHHVGAGQNLNEAEKPFIFQLFNKKIGVYACAEHEFSIAGENKVGANPFDPLYSLEHVEELKKNVDYVVVLYHGGKEHYRYPSPNLQKVCRRLVDKGADLVVCQHSHCIGCEEKYADGTVVYGQGNFIFDDCDNEFWQTSLLISIDENFHIQYIPLQKNGNSVRLAENGEEILGLFHKRSQQILKQRFIEKKYDEFAAQFLNNYLQKYAGKESIFFRVLNKISGGRLRCIRLAKKYDEKQAIALINYVECEAHKELLLAGLKHRAGFQ